MDKQKAMQELQELMERAKALEAIIQAPDVPESYHGVYIEPKEGSNCRVFYIDLSGGVSSTIGADEADVKYGLAFTTREAASKAQRILELRQKARVAMAKAWGSGKAVWSGTKTEKYSLNIVNGRPMVQRWCETYHPYSFPTKESADAFLNTLTTSDAMLLVMDMEAP